MTRKSWAITWQLLFLLSLCGTGCADEGAESVTGPVADAADGVPVFNSVPVTQADDKRPYEYAVSVSDPDGDPVVLSVIQRPLWATWDAERNVLAGTPDLGTTGQYAVRLRASDGQHVVDQAFSVTVIRGEIVCTEIFPDSATSPYVLPWSTGKSYRLIQGYCPSNTAWGHYNWFAYDFDTAINDTLIASRAGRVIAMQEFNENGTRICGQQKENWVFVLHEDGTVMQYVHLTQDGSFVSVGESVEQGQAIGLSGDSGCSSGPHVHVALFQDRTHYGRQSTRPLAFSNAGGMLDARGGLMQGQAYRAE